MSGIQQATNYGAACPQHTLSPLPGINFSGNYAKVSEDCLTLNVVKPSRRLSRCERLPVLVYFHGGGFEIGDASDTSTESLVERSIARNEPMIIVIPNYRLNGFGFLAGKEVRDAGLGNLGLHDQRMALQWVQNHIAAFGGDPNRVTIWGVSAGGVAVGMHLVSHDGDQGSLFQASFMQSGGIMRIPSVLEGQSEYDLIVEETNCHGQRDTLACLRRVPYDTMVAAIDKTRNIFSYSSLNLAWQPRVDNDLLRRQPYSGVVQGLYAKVPTIVGSCDDEGTLFSLVNTNITTDAAFEEYIESNYLNGASNAQLQQIFEAYPSDPSQGSPFDTGAANALTPQFKRLAAIQGDQFFNAPRRFFLEASSDLQQKWGYINMRGKSRPTLGTGHACDISQWFGRGSPSSYFSPDALIHFINTHNPNVADNSASDTTWPQWGTPESSSLLKFGDGDTLEIVADNFRSNSLEVLNEVLLHLPFGTDES